MTRLSSNARAFARKSMARIVGIATELIPDCEPLEAQVFRELSRLPEVERRTRDEWGNWEFSFGDSSLSGELYVPWLDRPLAQLRRQLTAEHPDWTFEPNWPEGRPFALCLTHDVDYVTQNPGFDRLAHRLARDVGLLAASPRTRATTGAAVRSLMVAGFQIATLRPLRPRAERTYEEWLKLEDRHGFRSTFFYFPERVSRPHIYDCSYTFSDWVRFDGRRVTVREMMRAMADGGWEIGLHGSYHSAFEPGMLEDQRGQVEAAAARQVMSTRQHWLHYDVGVTPGLQRDAGLLADSTQGFNRNVGFRAGTAFPYECWDHARDQALPLLEVPQHVMDGALFTANALAYDRDLAVRHCVRLMDEVAAVGGCLTLSWHPNVLMDPTYWSVYEDVLAEAAHRNAWGCSVGQLHEWWMARDQRLSGPPSGGTGGDR